MKDKLKQIGINIWDDFYDDGYVPEGKKQETFIYVEEADEDISQEKKKECLEVLLKYITENLNVGDVKIWLERYDSRNKYPHFNENDNPLFMKLNPGFHFSRWELRLDGLTHERLDEWMDHLDKVPLSLDDTPFRIYSES